ncbi:MAG: hypothetical protein H0U52_07935 [Chloroflexi bacterium]|nr:hypothetical protein [Chloroflexota bacterium]
MVTEAAGLPVAAGPDKGTIDGGLAIDRGAVHVGRTGPGGDVGGWQGDGPEQAIRKSGDGSAGIVTFRAAPYVDPEHPPAIRPPDQVGTMRWACGEPPARRPGRSTGQVALRLDAPIGGAWQVAAMCNWLTTPAGPRLRGVETHSPLIQREDATLGIVVSPNTEHPDRVDVALWVNRATSGDFYQPVETQIVVRQARDGGTGLVRLRHLAINPASEVRISDDVTDVSGVVSWTCPPPPVAGPLDDGNPAGEEPELRPGRARITFTPEVGAPAEGPITCTIDRSNAPTLQVRELRGSIPALGGRFELLSNGSRVILGLVGADGQPAGEYVGDALRFSDDPTQPDLELVVSPIEFEPTDPRYVPLGGPDGPRSVRLEIDYSCQL